MDDQMHIAGLIEEAFEHNGLLTRYCTQRSFGRRQIVDQLCRAHWIQLQLVF